MGQWGFVVLLIQVRDARFVIAIAAMHKARILLGEIANVYNYLSPSIAASGRLNIQLRLVARSGP